MNFVAPVASGWRGFAHLLAGEFVVAVAIGVVESTMARLRLPRVPQLLIGASVVAAIGCIILLGGVRP